ncbi:MAG: glycosyltransferase [candidate division WWE3 bacterium]|nr:glycosyltransferase [candidate division WWE3 bacterium]
MRIICLSNQLWDWPLWTNKRQVMSRLANLGHEVIFVDPPIRLQKLAKQISEGKWSGQRLLTGSRIVKTEFGENKEVLNYTPITLSYSEDPNLVSFNVDRINRLRVQQVEPLRLGLDMTQEKTVLWVYNVSMREYVDKIPHDYLIYDCVDNYPAMANYQRLGLSEAVASWEIELAKKSDLVFTSAPGLKKRLSQINPKTFFIPNAGNYELFSSASRERTPMPPSLENIPRPIIGFTGTIDDYKVDVELVIKAAKALPNYSFVIIGPHGEADKSPDLKKLTVLPNIHLLPQVKYDDQVPFYTYFDAFIIPYRLNDYTIEGCFPIKFCDALSSGLPVVVTNLPAYADFKDVCYIGDSDEEFVKMIKQAVDENSEERCESRRAIAKQNSWDGKVARQLNIISENL